MTIKSSFFNSVSGDRIYDASDFASYFASFIGNGVFPNPSNNLQVLAVNGNVLKVSVSIGKGFINGYYAENDAPLELQLAPADGTLSRIDRVVLALNTTNRAISAYVKTGTLNSSPLPPALTRAGSIYELGLADIRVNANTTSVTQANITDTRMDNDLCGFVSGVVNQVDTTTLYNQYQEAFNEFTTQQQQDFADWLAVIEAQLDGNTAGNLQNQINLKANIQSPSFAGTPTAPTPLANSSGGELATTFFVNRALNNGIRNIGGSITVPRVTTSSWIKIGQLSTVITAGMTKLALILDGGGAFSNNQYDAVYIQASLNRTTRMKVQRLTNNDSASNLKADYGYSVNTATGFTEFWVRVPAASYNLEYLRLGVAGGTFDLNTIVTTEPVGIVYSPILEYAGSSDIGNKNSLLTNDKSNLVGSINELFTSVSNGKNSIAAAITSKGVPSQGSDTFAQLTNNINAIENGSKIASGAGTVSSNAVFFTRTIPTATSVERLYLTVSGLSFFPARIVITAPQEVFNVDYGNTIRDPLRRIIMSGNSSTNQYEVISQQGNAVVSGTGFTLPMPFLATPGQSVRWTAYSQ